MCRHENKRIKSLFINLASFNLDSVMFYSRLKNQWHLCAGNLSSGIHQTPTSCDLCKCRLPINPEVYLPFSWIFCRLELLLSDQNDFFHSILSLTLGSGSVIRFLWLAGFIEATKHAYPVPPSQDMRYAGKQFDEWTCFVFASRLSTRCGKVERNNKYPNISRVPIPFKCTYEKI